jgi:hypothetical protein
MQAAKAELEVAADKAGPFCEFVSAITAGSSSIPNATVRSNPWGPVTRTRKLPLNGSADDTDLANKRLCPKMAYVVYGGCQSSMPNYLSSPRPISKIITRTERERNSRPLNGHGHQPGEGGCFEISLPLLEFLTAQQASLQYPLKRSQRDPERRTERP